MSHYFFAIVCFTTISYFEIAYGHSGCLSPDGRGPVASLNCGTAGDGVGWRQGSITATRCGVCGDQVWNKTLGQVVVYNYSLAHEFKGKYWPSKVVDTYIQGQIIPVKIAYWNAHGGKAEWRICSDTKWEAYNQSCFDENLVEVVSTDDPRFVPVSVTTDNVTRRLMVNTSDSNVYVNVMLRLPANVTCSRCVLQYSYLGGASQMFRTCSDIQIVPYGQMLMNSATDNLCLSVNGILSNLKLTSCNASDLNQILLSNENTLSELENDAVFFVSNGFCLDVSGGYVSSGTSILNWKCWSKTNPTGNQGWSSRSVNATAIQIVGTKSQMCLTATAAKVFQTTCNVTDARQLWIVLPYLNSTERADEYNSTESDSSESTSCESNESRRNSNGSNSYWPRQNSTNSNTTWPRHNSTESNSDESNSYESNSNESRRNLNGSNSIWPRHNSAESDSNESETPSSKSNWRGRHNNKSNDSSNRFSDSDSSEGLYHTDEASSSELHSNSSESISNETYYRSAESGEWNLWKH